jgi:CHAT domain-containing protein
LDGCGLPVQAACARLTLADSVLALGDVDRAVGMYRSTLDVLESAPALAWRAYAGQGRAAETKGGLREAYGYYSEAISRIQLVQEGLEVDEFQAGFLEDKLQVYQREVREALALKDRDAAYDLAERAKGGVWRDALAQPPAESEPHNALQPLRARWHWLYNRLTRLEPEQEAALDSHDQEARWAELRAVERQIAEVRRTGRPALQRRAGPALSTVQQCIPQGTLLVDYTCSTDQVIAFVLDVTHVEVLSHLAPRRAVEEAIQRWAFNVQTTLLLGRDASVSLSEDLLAEAQHALHDLYQLLCEPLLPHLDGHRSLWIVPHGPLWSVPFAALYDGRQYLVERFAVTYLPAVGVSSKEPGYKDSARTSAPLDSAPPARTPLAGSALIAGCSEGGQLAHAIDEARAVAAALGKGTLLLEAEATGERIRSSAETATLIHLATHGVFRSDAPLFSCLHLGDGWLTAGDLEGWRMPHAELVTLSACETGVSRGWGSDLLGLARGFFRAGARRLVASRWTVDDASTTAWMTAFYRALRAGQGVASALQDAQLATMSAYRYPFHWAGFELLQLI